MTVYIGLLTGKSVSKQGAFAETVAGRYLERRFHLEPVALDHSAFLPVSAFMCSFSPSSSR